MNGLVIFMKKLKVEVYRQIERMEKVNTLTFQNLILKMVMKYKRQQCQ